MKLTYALLAVACLTGCAIERASAQPSSQHPAPSCAADTSLSAFNAAWIEGLAGREAQMMIMGCAASARRPGPYDLLGHRTYVRCAPDQLCSPGADGARDNGDDV